MVFCKFKLIIFGIIAISLISIVASSETKVRKLPANFTFDAVRVQPDGEIRRLQMNPAKRNWENEPPLGMAKPRTRVVGGRKTPIKDVPYQVVVGVYGSGLLCGGTIYNKEWIITGAHCFFRNGQVRRRTSLFVTAGDFDLTRVDRTEQARDVADYLEHEEFFPEKGFNDIGLIKLDKPLEYTDVVQPLPLGPPGEEYPAVGEAVISGWGYTKIRQPSEKFTAESETYYPKTLRSTTINVYSRDQCKEIYGDTQYIRFANSTDFLCAGETKGGKDACQGDSGGPLRCTSGGKKYLCGVIARGIGCGLPKLPGFFTITSKFIDWIKKRAGEGDQPTITY